MVEQRTPEWFAERAGKVTASRISDILATTKSGPAASRANYMAQLACERLTGQVAAGYTNAEMQWGIDQEPFARAAYESRNGLLVEEVGFIPHPEIAGSGASPDGLVADDGLVEIKCPSSATALDTWLNDVLPEKYHLQMQWQMACTGRTWCDYVVFDPRLPEKLHLYVKRVARNDDLIRKMESEVAKFLSDLETKVSALKERFGV